MAQVFDGETQWRKSLEKLSGVTHWRVEVARRFRFEARTEGSRWLQAGTWRAPRIPVKTERARRLQVGIKGARRLQAWMERTLAPICDGKK